MGGVQRMAEAFASEAFRTPDRDTKDSSPSHHHHQRRPSITEVSRLSAFSENSQLVSDLSRTSERHKDVLELELGRAGDLRHDLESFSQHVKGVLTKMQDETGQIHHQSLRDLHKDVLNATLEPVLSKLSWRDAPLGSGASYAREASEMAAFLEEAHSIAARATREAEKAVGKLKRAEAKFHKQLAEKDGQLRAAQKETGELLMLRSDLGAHEAEIKDEMVRNKKEIKRLQRHLARCQEERDAAVMIGEELKADVKLLKAEIHAVAALRAKQTVDQADLAGKLSTHAKASRHQQEILTARCEAAEEALKAVKEKLLVERQKGQEALASAAAKHKETVRSDLQAVTESNRQQTEELRRELQAAQDKVQQDSMAKEDLMEAARSYQSQAVSLREEMAEELRASQHEAHEAMIVAEQQVAARQSADAEARRLRGETEGLKAQLEEATAALARAQDDLQDLQQASGAAGDLGQQLAELRELRSELDTKAQWLTAQCQAQGPMSRAPELPVAAQDHSAASRGRELVLARERGHELSTTLAAKEAELARHFAEARRASEIISQLRSDKIGLEAKLIASQLELERAVQARAQADSAPLETFLDQSALQKLAGRVEDALNEVTNLTSGLSSSNWPEEVETTRLQLLAKSHTLAMTISGLQDDVKPSKTRLYSNNAVDTSLLSGVPTMPEANGLAKSDENLFNESSAIATGAGPGIGALAQPDDSAYGTKPTLWIDPRPCSPSASSCGPQSSQSFIARIDSTSLETTGQAEMQVDTSGNSDTAAAALHYLAEGEGEGSAKGYTQHPILALRDSTAVTYCAQEQNLRSQTEITMAQQLPTRDVYAQDGGEFTTSQSHAPQRFPAVPPPHPEGRLSGVPTGSHNDYRNARPPTPGTVAAAIGVSSPAPSAGLRVPPSPSSGLVTPRRYESPIANNRPSSISEEIEALKNKASGKSAAARSRSTPVTPSASFQSRKESPFRAVLDSIERSSAGRLPPGRS